MLLRAKISWVRCSYCVGFYTITAPPHIEVVMLTFTGNLKNKELYIYRITDLLYLLFEQFNTYSMKNTNIISQKSTT